MSAILRIRYQVSVTASDLSFEFLIKVEPFLLLEEIENHVRRLIERGQFTRRDLINYCELDEKNLSPTGIPMLTIGDYVRLMQKPQAWGRLQLELDQKRFVADLDEVRTIRNDVMHFNPDPISTAELDALRSRLPSAASRRASQRLVIRNREWLRRDRSTSNQFVMSQPAAQAEVRFWPVYQNDLTADFRLDFQRVHAE